MIGRHVCHQDFDIQKTPNVDNFYIFKKTPISSFINQGDLKLLYNPSQPHGVEIGINIKIVIKIDIYKSKL